MPHGAAIESRNRAGFTALHLAAEGGSEQAAEALLTAGADAQAANSDACRPVETAREEGHDKVARLDEAAIR